TWIRKSRWEIALAHRFATRNEPDGTGGTWQPLQNCPKTNRSGSCVNCRLHTEGGLSYGARARYNRFAIRELYPPPSVEFDSNGEPLRKVHKAVIIDLDDLGIGGMSPQRVGDTVYAAPVPSYRGRTLDQRTRRTAPIFLFRRDPDEE